MSTSNAESRHHGSPAEPRRPSLADQARAKGTPVIVDGTELMDPELFADAEEHGEFLMFVRESRRAGAA